MPAGALEIDTIAHRLMDFRPVREVEKDGYSVFYHEGRLYSVRNVKSGMMHLLYAESPSGAIDKVKNEFNQS